MWWASALAGSSGSNACSPSRIRERRADSACPCRGPPCKPWSRARRVEASIAIAGRCGEADARAAARLAALRSRLLRESRARGHSARARRRLPAARARRRSAAHPGGPAHRAQSAWLRSVPHPERLRGARRRAAGRAAARAPHRAPAIPFPNPSPSCCGARTISRPRAARSRRRWRSDRRAAALRRLRPPRRRELMPLAGAGPAADRRDGHPVGNFPRPAAAADQAAGRGRFLAASADEPLEQNFVRKHALRYQQNTAAIWRPRRCGCSATPRAPTDPMSIT